MSDVFNLIEIFCWNDWKYFELLNNVFRFSCKPNSIKFPFLFYSIHFNLWTSNLLWSLIVIYSNKKCNFRDDQYNNQNEKDSIHQFHFKSIISIKLRIIFIYFFLPHSPWQHTTHTHTHTYSSCSFLKQFHLYSKFYFDGCIHTDLCHLFKMV